MKKILLILMLAFICQAGKENPALDQLPDPSDRASVRHAVIASALESMSWETKDLKFEGKDSMTYRAETLSLDTLHNRFLTGMYGNTTKNRYTELVKANVTSVFNLVYLTWKKYYDVKGIKKIVFNGLK
jgi:hypothetical protein